MLTSSDLIHLPYTPDLTGAGISYACRSLAYNRDRMGDSQIDQLRRVAGGVAVELSFRRYLSEQVVPYDVLGATPFTHPDQYDISLGGHRCIVKSCLVSRRNQIARLRRDPGSLLQAAALLPADQFTNEEHKPDDLYLFAFILGPVTAAQADIDKAITADQPVALIHLMPEAWARPATWIPLEKMALKSECRTPVTVEIGGQDVGHNFITVILELPPRQRMLVEQEFHSLAYIHSHSRPEARIGIHSPRHGEPYLITTNAWSNLWIYGMEILFSGWLTHADFRRNAMVLNAGAHTFLYDRTRVKNLMIPLNELNPLGILFKKVKNWAQGRKVENQVVIK